MLKKVKAFNEERAANLPVKKNNSLSSKFVSNIIKISSFSS